ncbi:MAG: phenylalanine--tRNA ligase subunit beta [Candidatus Kerfeldbacteria bacterium]|nr:phenylalanine--tRNA ligase subunit beta [Candidatus Kerfeldbacteria bacterium]
MKIPLSWLREFVEVKLPLSRLAERLTMAGIEVEEIIDRQKDFARIVVGEVVDLKPHPDAEKLRLAYVLVKKGSSPLEIVCGAPNVAVGQKVAVALLGARLPSGLTIVARPIRGVVSQGMVCSERELGLGTDQTGIMVLDSALTAGTPFAKAAGFDEPILDLAIPANRSDLQSVRGVAWEMAALLGQTFRSKPVRLPEGNVPASRSVRVTIADRKLCPLYIARVIRGVRVQPSPGWLQRRLRSADVRPVNCIVDAANYVMLEYGQPLHAFDAARVHGHSIIVRSAKKGERMETLDGKKRELDTSMLLITDPHRPIALAGVMGGADSEISQSTTDIILESAVFDPVSIRRTSRKLGLVSEASLRFEKGLPLKLAEQASRAAASLVAELCGGAIDKGKVRVGVNLKKETAVRISPSFFGEVLGLTVTPQTAKRVLTRLGFKVSGRAKQWQVIVPYWRSDVSFPEDLVEEVARIIGYDSLPETPLEMPFVPDPLPQLYKLKEDIRDLLVSFGFIETMSHAYYGESWARNIGGKHFAIANPLDQTQRYLRRSMVPQLLGILHDAVNAGNDAKVFQIGRVFTPISNVTITDQQPWKLAIGLAFKPAPGYIVRRKLTGVLDGLFEALGVLGIISGKVNVDSAKSKGRLLEWCELDIATMRNNFAPFAFKPLPKFPGLYRDLAVWIPGKFQFQDSFDAIVESGKPLLEKVELFDVFEKDGRRSLAFHLTFRAPDRTLTDDEILATMRAITQQLKKLGVEIR